MSDHLITVPIPSGQYKSLRALTLRGGIGATVAKIVAAHLRTIEIGRKDMPELAICVFDAGGGP